MAELVVGRGRLVDQTNAVAKVYQPGGSETPFAINADGTFSKPGSWVEASVTRT